MEKEEKPDIIRGGWYGSYVQETGRLLCTLVRDMKRVHNCIKGNTISITDQDIKRVAEYMEPVILELELMIAHKFPSEIDINESDLLKHYGMKIDKSKY